MAKAPIEMWLSVPSLPQAYLFWGGVLSAMGLDIDRFGDMKIQVRIHLHNVVHYFSVSD